MEYIYIYTKHFFRIYKTDTTTIDYYMTNIPSNLLKKSTNYMTIILKDI